MPGTAAAPLNGTGVVGVAPEAQLVPVKVFDDAGNSAESLVLCGLDYVTGLNTDADPANDVDVASMSFGESRAWGDCVNDALHAAICAASATGMVLVGGAGNSAVNAGTLRACRLPRGHQRLGHRRLRRATGRRWPAADSCSTSSGSSATTRSPCSATTGPVDVTAPGVAIYSTWAGGGYNTISGTSMATPHVSGVAALMKAANPALSTADVLAMLLQSGECPNGAFADADGTAGCVGQGT